MNKIKDKDIQYVYDVIAESTEIQNLIKRIANGSNSICSSLIKNDNSREAETLSFQVFSYSLNKLMKNLNNIRSSTFKQSQN